MRRKSIGKTISKIISVSILVIIITTVVAFFLGVRAYVVVGRSMAPIIQYKSMVVNTSPDASDIKIGDSITYRGSPNYISFLNRTFQFGHNHTTHQLVRIRDNDQVIAEFRKMKYYHYSWEEGDAYIEEMPQFGNSIDRGMTVAWYSGQEITEDMMFLTMGTFYSSDVFFSEAVGKEKYCMSPDAVSHMIEDDRPTTRENDDSYYREWFGYNIISGVVRFHIPYAGIFIEFVQENLVLVLSALFSVVILVRMIKQDLERKAEEEQDRLDKEEEKNELKK